MKLVDTHCHINDRAFEQDLEEVLERARKAGVGALVCVGYDVPSSQQAVELAERYEQVWATVGVHPHDAKTLEAEAEKKLKGLAKHPKVVAIGEIGLDFYRDLSPREVQAEAFKRQLELAAEADLPVVLHDREATEEVLKILEGFAGPVRGVAHCFSGDLEQAKRYVALGFWLGVDGPVTYKRNDELRATLAGIGLEHLVVETDSPYLAPQAKRGKRNEPSFLPYIVEKVAEICHCTYEEAAESTSRQAEQLFGRHLSAS